MPKAKEKEKKVTNEIDKLVENAMKKVDVEKESALARYLPDEKTGCINHLKLAKMKKHEPEKFCKLIEKYIFSAKEPKKIMGKRVFKERKYSAIFTKDKVHIVLENAYKHENIELIKMFSNEKMMRKIRSELIASLYRNKPNHELWKRYNLLLQASVEEKPKED